MPVSLRMPAPADAKFAPTSSFAPVNSGFKYAIVDSAPSASPIHESNNYGYVIENIKSISKNL